MILMEKWRVIYMLDMNLLSQITMENINYDKVGCCDHQTMGYYMKLPEDIQKHYEYLLQNTDGTIDDRKWIECVWFEYWIDEKTFHYVFLFDEDTVVVNDDFNCDYINNLVLQRYKEEYENNR